MAGELPRGWARRQLRDLCTPVRDAVDVDVDAVYQEIGIRSHGKGVFIKPPTTGRKLGEKRVFRVVPDAFVANIVFAWEGALARTTAEHAEMVASHRFPMWQVVPDRLDLGFLVHYFRTAAGVALAAQSSPGGAGRNRTLNQTAFLRSFLPLPPLPEQKKIAAILSSVDDAIRATEAVIEQTRRVKQALLHELLTRGIGHTRFKMTEIGEIPEGWGLHALSHFLPKGAVQNGMYLPESEYGAGVPIVRIDSYDHGGRVRVAALKRLQASPTDVATFGLQEDDLLLNRVNSLSHIAKAALVPALAEPTVFESNMMRLRLPAGNGLRPRFLMLVLCLPSAVSYFQRRAKKAVAQTSVNQQDVAAFTLAVPPIAEQEQIVSMMDGVSDQVNANQASLAGLTATKSALLSALLTGRVRVTQ